VPFPDHPLGGINAFGVSANGDRFHPHQTHVERTDSPPGFTIGALGPSSTGSSGLDYVRRILPERPTATF
jgi:hypothetical protein